MIDGYDEQCKPGKPEKKLIQSNLCTTVTLGKWQGDHYIKGDHYI